MKRHETRRALRAIRSAWPTFRLGPRDTRSFEFDLGLLDLGDVLAAIDARCAAGAPAPVSVSDLLEVPDRPPAERDRHELLQRDPVGGPALWPTDEGATT